MFKWRLKACRVQAGFIQEEVAKELHVTVQTVINWETGVSSPSMEVGQKLSDLYGVPLELMDFTKIGNRVVRSVD